MARRRRSPSFSTICASSITMGDLEIEFVGFVEARATLMEVRHEVFVAEQGVPPELEGDDEDEDALHVIARLHGEVAGVGRLLKDGHIGRVAVRRPFRRLGVGKAIMEALLQEGERRGVGRFCLAAQTHAIGFYLSLGFQAYGTPYMEAGIEHTDMQKLGY